MRMLRLFLAIVLAGLMGLGASETTYALAIPAGTLPGQAGSLGAESQVHFAVPPHGPGPQLLQPQL